MDLYTSKIGIHNTNTNQMKAFCLNTLIVVFLFLCTNGLQAQTTQTKLNQVELMKQFIGTWTLVKCIAIQQDGKITFPYGEKPIGQILYDTKGNMMVEIMNQEIKKFKNDNPFQGIPEEIIPAYNGFLAYYGTYKILADSNLIIHNIKACSFPNWVGQNQKRRFEFENNKLILTTPAISSVQFELTWEKN